jgi:GcrA cell cycle regulator
MPAALITWNDDLVADLRSRCAAGESARTIAAAYGTTRNAIIGKCTRLGLTLTATPQAQCAKAASSRPPRKRQPSKRPPSARPRPPTRAQTARRPCCLLDLTNETCRWPLWNEAPDAPRLFCGAAEAKLHEGMPYCAEHARLAFGPIR